MYGFVLTRKELLNDNNPDYERIDCGDYVCLYNPLNRFENDKLFFEDEKNVFLLDGVIFNKLEFVNASNEEWGNTYRLLVEQDDNYMDSLRGSYCGITIDKKSGIIDAFTNHSGEHTVYYKREEKGITIFSNILILKECGYNRPIEANPDSCLELLSVGGGTAWINSLQICVSPVGWKAA